MITKQLSLDYSPVVKEPLVEEPLRIRSTSYHRAVLERASLTELEARAAAYLTETTSELANRFIYSQPELDEWVES